MGRKKASAAGIHSVTRRGVGNKSEDIGDSQRVRDGFTEETISALGLQGSRGVYSVDKIGNGF